MQPHIRLVEANARDHILLTPPKVLKFLGKNTFLVLILWGCFQFGL